MNTPLPYPLAGLLGALLMSAPVAQAESPRWYDDARVEAGAPLFARHCAACHGAEAQGLAEDWRKPQADGHYPPPPLNGTAHAWHHPLKILRKTVRDGGAKLGGVMPGFADTLNAGEIDAILAWVQNHWNDDIYAAWLERGGLKGSGLGAESSDDGGLLRRLRQRLPALGDVEPRPSGIAGVLAIPSPKSNLYLSSDGRYLFVGDLFDLESGVNLSERERRAAGTAE